MQDRKTLDGLLRRAAREEMAGRKSSLRQKMYLRSRTGECIEVGAWLCLNEGDGYGIRAFRRGGSATTVVVVEWTHPNYGYWADGCVFVKFMHSKEWMSLHTVAWAEGLTAAQFQEKYPCFRRLFEEPSPQCLEVVVFTEDDTVPDNDPVLAWARENNLDVEFNRQRTEATIDVWGEHEIVICSQQPEADQSWYTVERSHSAPLHLSQAEHARVIAMFTSEKENR